MTKLLVSVRDANEAQTALDSGVDLIDVKEPNRGSLGKADNTTIEKIAQVVGQQRPVSVALGELADYNDHDFIRFSFPASVRFAKIGLARCGNNSRWPRRLENFWECFPGHVQRIAVIYADWQTADAPPPEEILHQASHLNCSGVLVDTFDKSRPGLAMLCSANELQKITAALRQSNLISVLAGRIMASDIAKLLPYHPDFIAVRSAVCHPDRNGTIEAVKIWEIRKLLAANLELQ